MAIGYSLRLVERNKDADSDHLGVRLGRMCIKRDIPVAEVAEKFGVSRQTVYNWFGGEASPADGLEDAIRAYLATLT